ncbi:protein pyrABCN [Phakopsora pachyrhizi]|uniref:Protein pyrABCN n=1 Tax=Phakopsora pachyrhizi TaxID=170000 RepID=A0AAV0AQ73_PHAPC|nr:protein pyrABCN [Phakopsora pachyrhizi]
MSRSPSISCPRRGIPALPSASPPISSLKAIFTATPGESEDGDLVGREQLIKNMMVLELADGTIYQGYSFGAQKKSISGECVFQTGMVGYPESLTDPSYEGQILVLTYPLIGSYGVPERNSNLLPNHLESSRIHVAALVVGSYSGEGEEYSHYLASSSLGKWLQDEGIPAIYGVDTRALTKRIRKGGVILAKLLAKDESKPESLKANLSKLSNIQQTRESWRSEYIDVALKDPNEKNLVEDVSRREPRLYKISDLPSGNEGINPIMHPKKPRAIRILALDVGMKNNQIRCFLKRGVELFVVPWDHDFLNPAVVEPGSFDGLFISNGPGDPKLAEDTIQRIRQATEMKEFPIFGICLGHQLLALAAGAKTLKLKYGNRGQNIPCTDLQSGRCYITSQNHGYAVDTQSLPEGWKELFVNANDQSNEGIYSTQHPYFSVQFHPESAPGPQDTEFLFDIFLQSVISCSLDGSFLPVTMPGGSHFENSLKNPRVLVKKVLVLGSGGLSIGQAGEFDYSGSQAIKALKQEGVYTILINPNIATIQTSKGLADKVYFLPVTPEFVRKVIQYERPDGIYCTFGGQTALSVGIAMAKEFEELGVQVLGTPISTIVMTEDRELFANSMAEIGEKCAMSASATSVNESIDAANKIGYPVILRAAYALGGLGSGFANNEEELVDLCGKAFAISSQVLIERSMKGWKEVEYEVVHSIVVAPSQTLSDEDYHMLRTTAINVIRHLGVVGECNIQYALNPNSKEYAIIEVNARLSRSSALASKATGYPLAFIAAKLGLGIPLNEIRNSVTKVTSACFEPSLDYCVVKMPRWDLKKFQRVSSKLGSSMKSVGEVMAIGRNFEEAIQKAIRSADPSFTGFDKNHIVTEEELKNELMNPTDRRIFAIANAFDANWTVDEVWELTKIDKWFLHKLENLVSLEKIMRRYTASHFPVDLLRYAKQLGFSDNQIAKFLNSNELAIRRIRLEFGIRPFVKQIDTVAAEFPAFTNYLFNTYNAVEHDVTFEDRGIIVLGSGVYRIGSSVEFDWCAVRAIRTLRGRGLRTVMINYNPETVSTDFDEADRLYFENISLETVLDIYDAEKSSGVIISMGGQTPNNIALPLHRQNVKILGTSPDMIDNAENRYKFSRLLDKIGVDQPRWKELTTVSEAHLFCETVGYPVLVRPSYVLSGAAMNVVYSADDLSAYLAQAAQVSREYPVVVTKYIEGAKEIEMDAVASNGKMMMHYICEHVENAGVHSGDATLILPPQDLDPETVRRIEIATQKIGNALNITGPFNIQFIAKNNEIKVIECNVRASRSFPFVSKVTGIDAVSMATDIMLGFPVKAYPPLQMPQDYVGVKAPQFSFARLAGADPVLGVEMASTGEVACFGKDKYEAYLKAILSTNVRLPKKSVLFSIGAYADKLEMLPSVQRLHRLGYTIYATAGTNDFITEHGIPCKFLEAFSSEEEAKGQKAEYSLIDHLKKGMVDLFINLPSRNRFRRPHQHISRGYRARRTAIDHAIPLVTNVKNAKILIEGLARYPTLSVRPVDAKSSHETVRIPGLVDCLAFVEDFISESSSLEQVTSSAARSGFLTLQISPISKEGFLEDSKTIKIVQDAIAGRAQCNYAFAIAATNHNVTSLAESPFDQASSLVLPLSEFSRDVNKAATIAAHFASWPANKPIVTDAATVDLSLVLLLASLHDRNIHVVNVKSVSDVEIIVLSKQKGLKVTADISIYALFLNQTLYPQATCLPTAREQEVIWEHLESFDTFSVGKLPFELARELGKPYTSGDGYEESIQLLLSALNEGRLSLDDIKLRCCENPAKIFDLPIPEKSFIEVEVDRSNVFLKTNWSPLQDQKFIGTVHRVVLSNETVYLDGFSHSKPGSGKYLGASLGLSARAVAGKTQHLQSVTDARKASSSFGSLGSPQLSTLQMQKARSSSPSLNPGRVGVPFEQTSLTGSRNAMKPSLSSQMEESRPAQSFFTPNLNSLSPPTIGLERHPAFHRRHILSVQQFTRQDLHALFSVAQEMRTQVERSGVLDILKGKVMCSMFYEPSTRTSASFEAAMNRLGGRVVSVSANKSSATKGESLEDTIRTLGCYGDAIILRHPAAGSSRTAAKVSPVPIINAGDGIGEHPTQAFLDVYTIREELGTVNGLTITMVGDLKNGRTVHSLVKLLGLYQVNLIFVSPISLAMPDAVKVEATRAGITYEEFSRLDEVIGRTDVLYMTRVQQERFENPAEYEALKDSYRIDHDLLSKARKHTIILHPLPRNSEIDPEVDLDPLRAAYFRQMRHGLFVRMALLTLILTP